MPTFRRPNRAGSSRQISCGIHHSARIGDNFREVESSVGPDCTIGDSVYLKYVDVGPVCTIGYHSTLTGEPKERIVLPEGTTICEGAWILPRYGYDFYDLGDGNYAYTAKTREGRFQAVVNLDGIEIKSEPYTHGTFPMEAIGKILKDYGIIFSPNAINTTSTQPQIGKPSAGF